MLVAKGLENVLCEMARLANLLRFGGRNGRHCGQQSRFVEYTRCDIDTGDVARWLFRSVLSSKKRNSDDISDLEGIRRRIAEGVDESGNPAFALLKEYHAQGLAQARVSFWFSLVFASVGFAIIVAGLAVTFLGSEEKSASFVTTIAKPAITVISGTIIDAVAALFFVQSNKARQLMTEFFDRLRIDRKLDEALKLTEAIPEQAVASNLRAMMALRFVELDVDLATLRTILLMNSDDPIASHVCHPPHAASAEVSRRRGTQNSHPQAELAVVEPSQGSELHSS